MQLSLKTLTKILKAEPYGLTKWKKLCAPTVTIALITGIAVANFMLTQKARLITQGILLLAGAIHLFIDRKRPLFFGEMNLGSLRSGVYGTGRSKVLDSITTAKGDPIGRNFDERLIEVYLKGGSRLNWLGKAIDIPKGNKTIPFSLLNSTVSKEKEENTLYWRYKGCLIESKKGETFNDRNLTIIKENGSQDPFLASDIPSNYVRFGEHFVSFDDKKFSLREGWQSLTINTEGNLAKTEEQVLPYRFRPNHKADRENIPPMVVDNTTEEFFWWQAQ